MLSAWTRFPPPFDPCPLPLWDRLDNPRPHKEAWALPSGQDGAKRPDRHPRQSHVPVVSNPTTGGGLVSRSRGPEKATNLVDLKKASQGRECGGHPRGCYQASTGPALTVLAAPKKSLDRQARQSRPARAGCSTSWKNLPEHGTNLPRPMAQQPSATGRSSAPPTADLLSPSNVQGNPVSSCRTGSRNGQEVVSLFCSSLINPRSGISGRPAPPVRCRPGAATTHLKSPQPGCGPLPQAVSARQLWPLPAHPALAEIG